MKVPRDEDITKAMEKTLLKRKYFSSQHELYVSLNNTLKDEGFSTSKRRMMNLVRSMKNVKIRAIPGKANKKIERCPVCNGELVDVKVMNLKGSSVVQGVVCKRCGFKSKGRNVKIRRYEFFFM